MSDAAPAAPSPAPAPVAPAQPTAEAPARLTNFHERMAAKDAEFAKRVDSERRAPQTERSHLRELGDRLTQKSDPQREPDQQQVNEPPVPLPDQEPGTEEGEAPLEDPAPDIDPQTALAKYKEWNDSPDLPADFKTKLVEVPWGPHGTKLVTVDEAIQGYQRRGDSTRAYQEVKKQQEAIKQHEAVYQQHFEAIHDPDQFLEIYERNGYGDVLYKVAERLAQREATDGALVEAAGYAAMRQYGCQSNDYRVQQAMEQARERLKGQRSQEVEMRQLQAERDRYKQQASQVDEQAAVRELGEKYRAQLTQLVPLAFKAHGLKDNQVNRAKHHRHLTDLMSATGATDITRQVVLQATEMLLEELHDARATPTRGVGQPISPTRQGTGQGQPRAGTTNGTPRGARMTDFRADMDRRNRQ